MIKCNSSQIEWLSLIHVCIFLKSFKVSITLWGVSITHPFTIGATTFSHGIIYGSLYK